MPAKEQISKAKSSNIFVEGHFTQKTHEPVKAE
jgi:hypothetical protein